jgi:hypothetical protein
MFAWLMRTIRLPFQIARRAWAGNSNAKFAIDREAKEHKLLKFTVPYTADADLLKSLVP